MQRVVSGRGPCRGGKSTCPVGPGELGQVRGGGRPRSLDPQLGGRRAPSSSATQAALVRGRYRSPGLGDGARSCKAAGGGGRYTMLKARRECGGVAPSQGA